MHLKWEITNRCTLNCSYCSNSNSNNILNIENDRNWLEVLEYFGKELNSVDFLGGEPFLYNELPLVVKECTKRGIHTTVVTNGQQNVEIGMQLLRNGIASITISIEGSRETHDGIRGEGTWDKAIKFLRNLYIYNKDYNLNCQLRVNFVVTKKNQYEIINLIEFCSKMNVEIQVTHIVDKGRAIENKDILSLNGKEYIEFYNMLGQYMSKHKESKVILVNATPCIKEYLNYLFDLKLQYGLAGCSANSSIFALDVEGNIYGCNLLKSETNCRTKIGQKDYYSMLEEQRKKIEFVEEQEKVTCLECRFREECHPCPYKSNANMPNICQIFTEELKKEILESERQYLNLKSNIRIYPNYKIVHTHSGEIVEYTKEGIDIYSSLSNGMTKSSEIAAYTCMEKEEVEYFLFNELLKNHIECKIG